MKCDEKDYVSLLNIWERSVRATHDFLTEENIMELKSALIPDYFPHVELYAAIADSDPVGFIGLSGKMIEMLFIDADSIGLGYGSLLVDFAKNNGAVKVDVNEQNPFAVRFYKSKGFHVIGRDETDEAGRPYPILHLSL